MLGSLREAIAGFRAISPVNRRALFFFAGAVLDGALQRSPDYALDPGAFPAARIGIPANIGGKVIASSHGVTYYFDYRS
jgi:hypothetical protein